MSTKPDAWSLDDAINRADLEEVRALLDSGVDPNLRDVVGSPMIVNAAWVAAVEIVELLIGRGADVNARDVNGQTALGAALGVGHNEYGHDDVVRVLRANGAVE